MKQLLSLFLLIFLFFSITAFVPGCASTRSRGNLSEAMEKASDEHEGSRKVENREDKEEDENDDSSVLYSIIWDLIFHSSEEDDEPMVVEVESDTDPGLVQVEEEGPFIIEEAPFSFPKAITLSYAPGFIGDRRLQNSHRFSIGLVGQTQEAFQYVLYGQFQKMSVRPGSSLYQSIESSPFSLGLGIDLRFLSHQNTGLQPYFALGFQMDALFWNYRNSIYADSYDEYGNYTGVEKISSDGVMGFDLHTGLGLNLNNRDHAAIGLEITPGMKFWWIESFEGFENDVFNPTYYLNFNIKFDLIRH